MFNELAMNLQIENVTRNLENTININNYSIERDENLALIEIALLTVIFFITIIGNIFVLLALWTRKRYAARKKLSRMYFFILHLSIADLLTAFLSVLPQLAWDITFRFYGGHFLCKFIKYVQPLGPYLSSYILMATAIDRHQAICYPLTYCSWTSRKSKIMVYLAWITSLLLCIPQLVIFTYKEILDGIYDCWGTFSQPWGEKAYVAWYSISIFIVPLMVLTITYSSICKEIWQSSAGSHLQPQNFTPISLNNSNCINSDDNNDNNNKNRTPLISRAKINTIKQMIAVILMYVICSSPFILAQLWATWDPSNPFFEGSIFVILALLYSLNSCVNPWIYLCFNKELRKLLLRLYTRKCKKPIKDSLSNSSGEPQSISSLKILSKWSLRNLSRSSAVKLSLRNSERSIVISRNSSKKFIVTTEI